MAYDQIVKKAANNSYIAEVMLRDSTTGMGKTGVAYGDVSYGYWREGAATGANGTCVAMSKGTYADHGWVEVDATNLPGVYQFGVPDAALATGANAATVILKATGAIDCRLRIVLVDVDLRDSVRLGVTALPNAAAAANGGLPTTNGTKLNQTADLTAGQSIAVSDKTGFALTAAYDAAKTAAPTVEEIDTQLSTTHGSGAWGGAVGSGGTQYQWPEDGDPVVDDDGSPLDGVAVWITSDEAGATTVAGPQYTLATGYVANKWLLDAGTYYAWVQLARYDAATNPTEITVS